MTYDELHVATAAIEREYAKALAEQQRIELFDHNQWVRPGFLTPAQRAGRKSLGDLADALMLVGLGFEETVEGLEEPADEPAVLSTSDAELLAKLIALTRGSFTGALSFNEFILQASTALVQSGRTMTEVMR